MKVVALIIKFFASLKKERTPAQKLQNVLKSMRIQLGIATAQNEINVGNDKVSLEISNIRECLIRAIAELENK